MIQFYGYVMNFERGKIWVQRIGGDWEGCIEDGYLSQVYGIRLLENILICMLIFLFFYFFAFFCFECLTSFGSLDLELAVIAGVLGRYYRPILHPFQSEFA